jgi:tight adherence protein B
MNSDTTVTLGLIPALAFGSVFLLVYGIQQALDRRSARLADHLGRFTPSQKAAKGPGPADLVRNRRRLSTIRTLDSLLKGRNFAERMDRQLASAGLPLRVGEFLLIRWTCALALGGLAITLLQSPLVALPAAIAGYFVPVLYVRHRQGQRTNVLNEQLVDALALMAGGLRAGYSFLQGIEAVARELPAPLSDEFRVLLEDLRLGVPAEEALLGLSRRAPTEDVDMVVTAMLVQRSSGGNLSEILDNIAHTIRERIRIRREVQTLTAQERISSYVVGALPIVAFAFLSLFNPDYLGMLFGTTLGTVLLAIGVALELLGFYIIRRIVDIRL